MPLIARTSIVKVNESKRVDADDFLAVEEPMEIRLEFSSGNKRVQKSISVTMRTPGNDVELAIGFLYTEGIIAAAQDIISVKHIKPGNDNILLVSLSENVSLNVRHIERNFYTTSSCGVCGKASIGAVRTACRIPESFDKLRIASSVLNELPSLLREQQKVFENTGGLHACALFDTDGKLQYSREDVGRHNALDKLIGAALSAGLLPLESNILLLSGRTSFELVQKAVMAGIKLIAAVGAPSSLAVEMAEEWGITLVGFLRDGRFNIYSGAERIVN